MRRVMTEKRIEELNHYARKGQKYKKFVYNRFFTCAFLAFVQISASLIFLFVMEQQAGFLARVIMYSLSAVFVLYLLNRPDSDFSAKAKWIVLILVVPIIGMSLFLLYGEGRPTILMNRKYEGAKLENAKYHLQSKETEERVEAGARSTAVSKYLLNESNYPAFTDGEIEYYPTGRELFEEMLVAAENAKKFILMEYFILAGGKMWDRLREILIQKAQAGVKVYVIYDDFGSILHLPHDYELYMEALHPNIQCMAFNHVIPVFAMRQNNRDHRKLFAVDNDVAFTGGLNVADEYIGELIRFGEWKDSGVKVTGAAVQTFTVMFFDLWNAFNPEKKVDLSELLGEVEQLKKELCEKQRLSEEKHVGRKNYFVQPFDDSPLDQKSDGEFVYLDIINRASKYVYIFTPYLILPDSLRFALCNASMRGVDVRIVTPAIPDKKLVFRMTRANYDVLMRHGVKIYEYTPGFIHSKSIVSDDECAVVGSINFDYRSLYLHFENAVYFTDESAVKAVRKDCEETFEISEIRTEENTKRTWVGRVVDAVLRFMDTFV